MSTIYIVALSILSSLQSITFGQTIIAQPGEYKDQTIQCNGNSACFIYCKEEESCYGAKIFCPINNPCIVSCGKYDTACEGAIIDARYSSLFELNDCSSGSESTCSEMTIYFPPNDNGTPRSSLNTGDNMKEDLTFYAIYGWLDIDTSSFTGTHDDIEATMYCGSWYQYSCEIDDEEWICEDEDDYCNSPPLPQLSTIRPSTSSDPEEKDDEEVQPSPSAAPNKNEPSTAPIANIDVSSTSTAGDDKWTTTDSDKEPIANDRDSIDSQGRDDFNAALQNSNGTTSISYLQWVIGVLVGCLVLCACIFSYYIIRHTKFYRNAMDIDKTKQIQQQKQIAAKRAKHNRTRSKSRSRSRPKLSIDGDSSNSKHALPTNMEHHHQMHGHGRSKTKPTTLLSSAITDMMKSSSTPNRTPNRHRNGHGDGYDEIAKGHSKQRSIIFNKKNRVKTGEDTPCELTPDFPHDHMHIAMKSLPALPMTQRYIRQITPSASSKNNGFHGSSRNEGHHPVDVLTAPLDSIAIVQQVSADSSGGITHNTNNNSYNESSGTGNNSYNQYLKNKKPSIDTLLSSTPLEPRGSNDLQPPPVKIEAIENDDASSIKNGTDGTTDGDNDDATSIRSKISSLSDITSMLQYFNVIGKAKTDINVLKEQREEDSQLASPRSNRDLESSPDTSVSNDTAKVKQNDIVPPPGSMVCLPMVTNKRKSNRKSNSSTISRIMRGPGSKSRLQVNKSRNRNRNRNSNTSSNQSLTPILRVPARSRSKSKPRSKSDVKSISKSPIRYRSKSNANPSYRNDNDEDHDHRDKNHLCEPLRMTLVDTLSVSTVKTRNNSEDSILIHDGSTEYQSNASMDSIDLQPSIVRRNVFDSNNQQYNIREPGSATESDDDLFKHDVINDTEEEARNVIARVESADDPEIVYNISGSPPGDNNEYNDNHGFVFGSRQISERSDNKYNNNNNMNKMEKYISTQTMGVFTANSWSPSSSSDEENSKLTVNVVNDDKFDAMSADTWITYFKGNESNLGTTINGGNNKSRYCESENSDHQYIE